MRRKNFRHQENQDFPSSVVNARLSAQRAVFLSLFLLGSTALIHQHVAKEREIVLHLWHWGFEEKQSEIGPMNRTGIHLSHGMRVYIVSLGILGFVVSPK